MLKHIIPYTNILTLQLCVVCFTGGMQKNSYSVLNGVHCAIRLRVESYCILRWAAPARLPLLNLVRHRGVIVGNHEYGGPQLSCDVCLLFGVLR